MRILQALAMSALIGLVVPAIAQNKTATAKKPVPKTAAVTCFVSGNVIKNVAKAPKHTYNKKTYYFCCTGCLSKFKTTPTAYINKKVATTGFSKTASCAGCNGDKSAAACSGDKSVAACCDAEKAVIATEKTEEISKDMLYCPVMEEEIADVKKAFPTEYEGKTYYLCCTDCKKSFIKNPGKYIKKLEEWQKAQKAQKAQ